MSSIEAQLELEQNMVARGIDTYRKQKEAAMEGGRSSETGFARRIIDEYLNPLVEALEAELGKRGAGMYGRARVHLRELAADKSVFIALRNVLNAFSKPATPVSISNNIGRMIEDEVRFTRFEKKYSAYYHEIMKDFKKKGTKDYRYMHRVLTHSANNNEDGWAPWSVAERVDVGMRLLDLVLTNTDLITKNTTYVRGKTVVNIEPSEAALEFISKYDDVAALLHPRQMPCIIPPDPWTDIDQGGYYSPQLRSATRLVLANNREHRKLLRKADLTNVRNAVNAAQAVSWKVNSKVLDVARTVWAKNLKVGMPSNEKLQPTPSPFPDTPKESMTPEQLARFVDWKRDASMVYTAEKERVGQCFQTTAIIKAANDYVVYPEFWYVWLMDFRGRMYTATSGFSPQGPDLAKGMLKFSKGEPLGERGVYWLKVQGANKFGYDKATYDDRVKWVDERHAQIMAVGSDPIANVEIWSEADKPYQFLAFCFEYKEMMDGKLVGRKPEDYVSYLPVGLDGSCNGLQHFSAMLRDSRGGTATNLVPGDIPSDIYSEVAQVCMNKVNVAAQSGDAVMKMWHSFSTKYGKQGNLPRSVAKRPVMTMPYGSTRQSCTTYIYQSVLEIDKSHFGEHAAFTSSTALTPLLWSSIGEVVVAAREGMDWLQKCAGVMSKNGLGITWRTKDGFIVHMFERELETVRVETVLAGRFQARVANYSDKLDRHKQRSGIAPNFVHSQDAAHLRATVLKCQEAGVHSLALIHDDYGTHAAFTDTLHRLLRESFVEQYTEFDPLGSFKTWQEAISKSKMPALPETGTLVVEDVLKSEYFFG